MDVKKVLESIQVPQKIIINENSRWSYLTDKQLVIRLNRITNPAKLAAYYNTAKCQDKEYLMDKAIDRFALLTAGPVASENNFTENEKVKPIIKKKKIAEVETKKHKRALDF